MTAPHAGLLVSLDYWLTFVAWAVLDRALVGALSRRAHRGLLAVVSAVFLWWFTALDARAIGLLYGALSAIYVATRAATAAKTSEAARRGAGLVGLAGALVVAWALGKVGAALHQPALSRLMFLGASFLLVKLLSWCKDLADGRIEAPDILSFLAFCTYFPCFVSGPMHQYAEFQSAVNERSGLDAETLVGAVWRVMHGLVKVLVVARLLRPLGLEPLVGHGLSSVGVAELGVRSLVFSGVIYLDFSGYSDIVIGASVLPGIRVPENFRSPYLAANIRDFWQRWHITFTRFLTQYLFVPLTRRLQAARPSAGPASIALIGYAVTFACCGFWHGATLNFLLWGLYHGVALALYDVLRRREMQRARLQQKPLGTPPRWRRVLSVLATVAFVSIGWTFFVLPAGFWVR
ncbi:MAG: MBOAT family protein [Deltaproteobacteria bacterium]|nr:MBOAT family protein [Deltaproteobacteria bacterium]